MGNLERLFCDPQRRFSVGELRQELEELNKHPIQMNDRLHDCLFYEAWPALRIAEYLNKHSGHSGLMVRITGDSHSHCDAMFVHPCGREQALECTIAFDQRSSKLAIDHLTEIHQKPTKTEVSPILSYQWSLLAPKKSRGHRLKAFYEGSSP